MGLSSQSSAWGSGGLPYREVSEHFWIETLEQVLDSQDCKELLELVHIC